MTPIDHVSRVERLTLRLADGPLGNGCDALLFLDLTDVRWLTGFTGSNGWVVVTADGVTLGTDGRYGDRARAETASIAATVIVEQHAPRLHQRLVDTLSGNSAVALDASTTSHSSWARLACDVALEPTGSLVKLQRQIKDEAEIARIESAARAADAALADVEPMLMDAVDHPLSEHDVRTELEYRMRLHGADDRSYDTIVASGTEHAARPHHSASRRTIVEGDTVIIDVGALLDGYHSDMTRSWVIGDPTEQQREIYGLVVAAQRAGLEAVAAGVAAKSVDDACRRVFDEAGYLDWYLHGTGHGVGLDIHELPFHSQTSDDVLAAGMVVTVEPGLYRGGFGGFRIEDLVVVTESGHRVLTHSPKREL
jgi:Xaa-Pro aminopeptidase